MNTDIYKEVEIRLNDTIVLKSCGYVIQPSDWEEEEHKHSCWELVYVRKGGGRLYCNDSEYKYELCSGWLFKPGASHHFINNVSQRAECFTVRFSFKIDGKAEAGSGLESIRIADLPGGGVLERDLRSISEFIRQYPKDYSLYMKRDIIFDIISRLTGLLSGTSREQSEPGSKLHGMILTEKIKRYLEDHLDKSITVREIADLFYLSPHYFAGVFKKWAGTTIKDYHNNLRMSRAAELIQEDEYNLSEISQTLGFSSLHYFSRQFKKFYKISPIEYRNKNL
ncbi:MAG: AraC family transcriptional regulator [Planctomycetota bacterium]|jgi:AraC-like DNA-binding protein